MAELIGFPDVEATTITVLNTQLSPRMPGVRASTKVPRVRPDEFVRVTRIGGAAESIVSENATLIIEAYAAKEKRAFEILNLCRAILFAQDDIIFGVSLIGGVTNLPDPTTDQVRYTMTIGARVRGTALA